ncbi:sensory rhodopsin transducer [Actinomadura keratinilytica]
MPVGTDHCLVVTSDVPIVVRHTRLDSRQEANALMSTIAYPA